MPGARRCGRRCLALLRLTPGLRDPVPAQENAVVRHRCKDF